jgi:diaminopimelate decarboxylase/aspartate kinase
VTTSVLPSDRAHAPWVVVKFGGTSVASDARWLCIERIVRAHVERGRRVLVVCSALATVTNRLEGLVEAAMRGEDTTPVWSDLLSVHRELAVAMGLDPAPLLGAEIRNLQSWASGLGREWTPRDRAHLLAHGEFLSTKLGAAFLKKSGCDVARVDARELLCALPGGERDERYLSASCAAERSEQAQERLAAETARVVVTQGFIARGGDVETVLLGRGGSDASAAYLAAAIDAEAVEIFSDVPGLFTADPRVCPEARLLRRTSYAEAESLSALGVKALHPRTIQPLRERGIPLHLGATALPDERGTRITCARARRGVKAVASRQKLALLVMTRSPSFQPVGFMAEVSARFQRRGVSMDLVASSPSEIRATVDLAAFPSLANELDALLEDLREVCRPRVLKGLGSVSLVGTDLPALGLRDASWLDALSRVHVHLTAQAANGTHLTFVVENCEVSDLMAAAHDALVSSLDADDAQFGPRLTVPSQVESAAPPRTCEDEAAA